MSHRIATKTEITDKEAAEEALKAQKWDFLSSDDTITITGGPMQGATINCRTGEVVGDTDWHDKKTLKALNQSYAEVLVNRQIASQGGYVEHRETLQDGRVRILAQVTYA